jgi:hypothetical protein
VLGVHQVVARRELRERVDRGAGRPGLRASPRLLARSEDLLLGDDGEPRLRQHEALGERRRAHLDAAGRRPAPDRARVGRCARLDPVLGQQRAQPLGVRERRRRQRDAVARLAPRGDLRGQRRERLLARARLRELPAQVLLRLARDSDALDPVALQDVEPLEQQRAPCEQRLLERLRRERELFRCRDEPPALARELVVRERFFGVPQQSRAASAEVVDHDLRVLGQEVEHGLHAAQQERGERLAARRHAAPQQRVDERVDVAGGETPVGGELAQRRLALDEQRALDE